MTTKKQTKEDAFADMVQVRLGSCVKEVSNEYIQAMIGQCFKFAEELQEELAARLSAEDTVCECGQECGTNEDCELCQDIANGEA